MDPLCGGMPVVVISAYLDMPDALDTPDAAALEIQAVVAKPFDIYVLADTVERLLQALPEQALGQE